VLAAISCTALVAIATSFTAIESRSIYAHTFSQNENSMFLTRINQIKAELRLIQDIHSNKNNAVNYIRFVPTHAREAVAILNQKDSTSNFTWIKEIAEKNQRIANDLIRGLNNLIPSEKNASAAYNNNNSNLMIIQDKINNLNGLLDEAVSARVMKAIINNSTNQALVLANLGNEVFYSYGQALGFPQAKLANMVATMNMSALGGNNINIQGKKMMQNMNSRNNMNASDGRTPIMSKTANIQNESQYHNAQAYVKQAQEIVAKYLKSSVMSISKNSKSDIQPRLNRILSQLKMTIDNKGSFSSVMNLVHMQLHPTLISNYRIR
jgi:hypothetical protein